MRYLTLLLLLVCFSCGKSRVKGNATVTFELEPRTAPAGAESDKLMETVTASYTARLQQFGFDDSDFEIKNNGKRISVTLKQVDGDPARLGRLKKLLLYQGKVEFWETYEASEIFSNLYRLNELLRDTSSFRDSSAANTLADEVVMNEREKQENTIRSNPLFYYLVPPQEKSHDGYRLLPGPVIGYTEAANKAMVDTMLAGEKAKSVLPIFLRPAWMLKPSGNLGNGEHFELIALKAGGNFKAALSELVLENAVAQKSTMNGMYEISITMKDASAKQWAKITAASVDRAIAIVVDGLVVSYPRVQGEISGGKSTISGNFTREEAEDLALMLNTKGLPVEMQIVAETLK